MKESFARILYYINPLFPSILITLGLTSVVLFLLLIDSNNTWFNKKTIRVVGIFYGLSYYGTLRLACAWIRFCIVISLIFSFRELNLNSYVLFLIPVLLGVPLNCGLKKISTYFLTNIIDFVILFFLNTVYVFFSGMRKNWVLTFIYFVLATFVLIYNIYIFLLDVDSISSKRKLNNPGDYL